MTCCGTPLARESNGHAAVLLCRVIQHITTSCSVLPASIMLGM